MAQANAAVPATPAQPAQGKPQAADAKEQSKGPETPPDAADKATETSNKPANPIEAELQAQYGEDWNQLTPKARERIIAAEMKGREGEKRMQLAAKLKKELDMTTAQVSQLIAALKKDPWAVLKNPALGHDAKKLAEEYVWNMIQEERMTPEQREAQQTKRELSEMKAQQERAKKEQEERENEALTQQRREHWSKEIPKAMEEFKLPKTTYTIGRFAHYLKTLSKARIPADMGKIASVIRDEISGMQSQFLLPEKFSNEKQEDYEDRIMSSVPADFVKMLRRADLRRLRAKGLAPKPGPKPTGNPSPTQPKKMSMSDWLSQRDQRLGRK